MFKKSSHAPFFFLPAWFSILLIHAALVFCSPEVIFGNEVFRVGSYNVENLFDVTHNGTEYPAYIPKAGYGWTPDMLAIKAENISKVIIGLNAHILALQEVESLEALLYLRDMLRRKGLDYPWAAVTQKDETAVRCALLSMYPIIESRDIRVPGRGNRNILQATVEIDGNPLVLFVNHWRSRNAPESLRMVSAKSLMASLSSLPLEAAYILLGDFNANYNEFEIIRGDDKVNDTNSRTGINHVLRTIADGRLVDLDMLLQAPERRLHYNLWMELEEARRWSYLFSGQPRTLDNILLPAALYDHEGVSYIDSSFDKFDPHYLFRDGRIFRWQREDRGRGRHLGEGYSDHLPIYACFTTGGIKPSGTDAPCLAQPVPVSISDLYESKTGRVRYLIEKVTVIYKHGNNAVIKKEKDRAIYVYGAAKELEYGKSYSIVVNRMNRFFGNLQVTGLESVKPESAVVEVPPLLLHDPEADLSDPRFENEVVSATAGYYADGWLYYPPDQSIRLFFRDKAIAPEWKGPAAIDNARIGIHRYPQIVIEQKSQIHRLQ